MANKFFRLESSMLRLKKIYNSYLILTINPLKNIYYLHQSPILTQPQNAKSFTPNWLYAKSVLFLYKLIIEFNRRI